MTCNLCLKDLPLLNSHILPEFLYKPLYDSKHRFHALSTSSKIKEKYLQKGIREKLLCRGCELYLSRFERYVSLAFRGEGGVSIQLKNDIYYLVGLDYVKFTTFALSILWRAGISKLAVYSQVQLGPHEEILRNIILSSNIGEPNEYPFFLTALKYRDKPVKDLIVQPTYARIQNQRAYRFVFSGMIWAFIVSSKKLADPYTAVFLAKTGEIALLESNLEKMPFLVKLIEDLVANN